VTHLPVARDGESVVDPSYAELNGVRIAFNHLEVAGIFDDEAIGGGVANDMGPVLAAIPTFLCAVGAVAPSRGDRGEHLGSPSLERLV